MSLLAGHVEGEHDFEPDLGGIVIEVDHIAPAAAPATAPHSFTG